jgi:eukaryotic-like serine/threonine-protein kinase
LLTGSTPLEKRTLKEAAWQELVRLIKEVEPPRPSTRLSSSGSLASVAAQRKIEPGKLSRLVRGELDWIVMKALEKDRSRRYETANGLARDVQRYLTDETVEACPPSVGYRLRKFARKHRAGLTAAAAFAALLLLGVAVSAWQAIRARHAEELAVAARDAEVAERMEAEQQRDRAAKAEAQAQAEGEKAKQERDKAVTEKKRADDEAAIAQAVNDFLRKDLLGQTSEAAQVRAGFRPDPDVKMRTLLDRASAKVGDRFKDKPRVEAAVRASIGAAYHSLRNSAQGQLRQDLETAALMHQTRALELLEKALGKDHDETLSAVYGLGAFYVNWGQDAKAEPYFRRVFEGRQRAQGADDPGTLTAAHNLAFLYQRLGRTAEAEKTVREALERSRRNPDAERARAALMNNLGYIYSTQNRFAEAEPLLRQALDDYRRIRGDKDSQTRMLVQSIGLMYIRQGRGAEAEPLLREAFAVVQSQWGEQELVTTTALTYVSHALLLQGKYADAEPLLRKCLSIGEAKTPNSWTTFHVRSLLGEALVGQRRYADAEPFLVQG